jgi:Domain of unknown function (DUF4440)
VARRPIQTEEENMNTRNVTLWGSAIVAIVLAAPALVSAQRGSDTEAVAAITKLENDAVKADLASEKTFYEKVLADDWSGGDSNGKFYTKAEMVKMMGDVSHNKTNSEAISDLKVRVYGRAAVATYKDTYDAMFEGQHRSRTVISTDTFVKMGTEWKQVASHASTASGQ